LFSALQSLLGFCSSYLGWGNDSVSNSTLYVVHRIICYVSCFSV
jgi:hypothetical protein